MQYLGGKSRIAKEISQVMLAATDERSVYVEPFVGAGSVAAQMMPHFETAFLSDASPDLIALWQALQQGWQPPDTVTAEMHQALKDAPVSALRAFVGYGCSFGGAWFNTYARDPKHGRNFARTAANLLAARLEVIGTAWFDCLDYRDVPITDGAVIYCDPPYRGKTRYDRLPDFDSDTFWAWAEMQADRSAVFVSEYQAPEGWRAVWTGTPRVTLARGSNSPRPTEGLWVCGRLQDSHAYHSQAARTQAGHTQAGRGRWLGRTGLAALPWLHHRIHQGWRD